MSYELKIRRFKPALDLATVSAWLMFRDLPDQFKHSLPKLGWMVMQKDDHPIAVGFVRKMEKCKVGMVDSFMTNPQMPPKIRDEALNLLTARMVVDAKRLGFEKLIASTVDQHILVRACKYGFKTLPNLLLGRILKEGTDHVF